MININKKYISLFEAVIDLEEAIEEAFGQRFCENFSLQSFGCVQGKIDGKSFWFTPHLNNGYIDSICASSESMDEKNVLDELKPVLSKIMGGVDPFCKYDQLISFISYEKLDDEVDGEKEEKTEKRMCPTMEWNIIDPDSRIKNLIGSCGSEIKNLQLLNGKSISDYEEKDQEYTLKRK